MRVTLLCLALAGCGGATDKVTKPAGDLATSDAAQSVSHNDAGKAGDMAHASDGDMSQGVGQDFAVGGQDLAQALPDMTATNVPAGGSCTASSECMCYEGCSGATTAYGYCVKDVYNGVTQAQRCVVAFATYAQNGPNYNGYWTLQLGDQANPWPGYPAPGSAYAYTCSQYFDIEPATPNPKIPSGTDACASDGYDLVVP